MRGSICVHRSDDMKKGEDKSMTYSKPIVEIVKFDTIGFMTSSVGYSSPQSYAASYGVTGWNGHGNFECASFGDCNGSVNVEGLGTFTQKKNGKWYFGT